jgi:serine/threonine protein kinase/WD40 repeat protein
MNTRDRHAEEILATAMEIADAAARRAYLDRTCAGNEALRREVESLLAADQQAGAFMSAAAGKTTLPLPPSEKAGERIGRYKLLEQIGEGGFGVVWMAEQEEPVRRRVALKIIKLGMDTREVVARLEAERQALAMMDHPHIASVFDGGATDTGRPYFVMELVKGIPITDYCDANKLSTRERLELFMQVCHAVQHAHQKGVIHRDLKPSNILVTVKDDRPVPKVIDFGIAKATQARLTEKTLFTRLQQRIGTPAYMSPEQAGLGSLDVDTRSDVYSLGVLLYELLTGRTPFDTQRLLAAGYDAVMRTIREEEPPKPSTRLSTLKAEELSAVAAQRGAESAKLGRLVRGDLDWIVMKALEKDRQRRYETASAFARDLERYMNQEPVSAAAPSLGYQLAKFARRNRGALATLAAFVVLLLTGTAMSVWQAIRATESAHQADTQQRIATNETARATRLASESELARRRAETNAYVGRILLASQFLQSGDRANAEQALNECDPALRRWEWHYLQRSLHGELLTIAPPQGFGSDYKWPDRADPWQLRFTRDGTRLWISWHPEGSLFYEAIYSVPDGRRLVGATNECLGLPNRDGSKVVRRATAQTPAAIIETATGRVLTTLEAAQETPVALSPDESLIAAWAVRPVYGKPLPNRLLIASANTGRIIREIGLSDGGKALLWSPDGRWLVAAGEKTNQVVEVQSGRAMFAFEAVNEFIPGGLAFSSNGNRLARVNGSGGSSEPLSVWDLSTQRRLFERPLPNDDSISLHVCFAEGDQTLVVAFIGLAAGPGGESVEDDLCFFDAVTGAPQRRLRLDSRLAPLMWGVCALAASPDGEKVAAGTADGNLYVLGTKRPFQRRLGRGRQTVVHLVAFNHDGTRLAALDSKGEVTLWDVSEPERLDAGTLSARGRIVIREGDKGVRIEDLDRRECLTLDSRATLSPDGQWLCREDGVWSIRERRLVRRLAKGEPCEQVLDFSGDGCRAAVQRLAREAKPGLLLAQVEVVDTATWTPVTSPLERDSPGGFALSFDGSLAAVASSNASVCSIYEFSTNAATPSRRCAFSGRPPFQFSVDGSWLLAGRRGGGFQQVESRRGELLGAYAESGAGATRFEISTSGRYACVHFSTLGGLLEAGVFPENCPWPVQVWDLTTGQLLARAPQAPSLDCSVLHPDGTRMALSGQDSVLRLWDLETRAVLATLPVKAKDWRWSRDGGKLTTVTLDGEIQEFDGSQWKPGETRAARTPFRDVTAAWPKWQ